MTDPSSRCVPHNVGSSCSVSPERLTLLSVVSHDADDGHRRRRGRRCTARRRTRRCGTSSWSTPTRSSPGPREACTASQVDKRVEIGDAATTICDVAAELGVDVIVVGSHGRKGISRLFLGSTSEHVVRHAPCPVLVVREQNSRVGEPQRRPGLAVPLAVRVRRERVAAGWPERARGGWPSGTTATGTTWSGRPSSARSSSR